MVATPAGAVGQGGIDRAMATLAAALSARPDARFSVRFCASRGGGPAVFSVFYLAAFCLRLVAARLRGRLDLVHVNLSQGGSVYRKLVIAAAARLLRVPYVLHLHVADFDLFWPPRGLLDRLLTWLFGGAAQIVVLGSVWRERLVARLPAVAGRIAIVPNASAPPALHHRGGEGLVHILFLGRIGARKGVPQLGDALFRLKGLENWRATIAGDGAVEEARRVAAQLGLVERVALPGWVGPEQVADLLASADILVLPSFAEGLPVSVVEGMGAGLAVVATPVGAVPDIIVDGQSGLLVPPGDVDALTAALARLVGDPPLRQRLGAAARAVHRQRLEPAPVMAALFGVWLAAVRPAPQPGPQRTPLEAAGAGGER